MRDVIHWIKKAFARIGEIWTALRSDLRRGCARIDRACHTYCGACSRRAPCLLPVISENADTEERVHKGHTKTTTLKTRTCFPSPRLASDQHDSRFFIPAFFNNFLIPFP
jgi:hypothetical protein